MFPKSQQLYSDSNLLLLLVLLFGVRLPHGFVIFSVATKATGANVHGRIERTAAKKHLSQRISHYAEQQVYLALHKVVTEKEILPSDLALELQNAIEMWMGVQAEVVLIAE